MLDLETLSTRSNAVILVIAAVKFNRTKGVVEEPEFYRHIDIDSCKAVGLTTDDITIKWWNQQSEAVRNEAFGGVRLPLYNVLKEFRTWYGNNVSNIWCQGANFDIPILDEAYKRCKIESPWKFWEVRDTRTLYDVAKFRQKDLQRKGDNHNALHDCRHQISCVVESFRKIK